MLDLGSLRKDPDAAARRLAARGFAFDAESFRALESERSALQRATERLQNERNRKSKAIGQAKAQGEDIAPLIAELGGLGERLAAAKARLAEFQEKYRAFLLGIPNLPDPSVPLGESDADNLVLERWGTAPEFDFEPLDHVDLGAGGALDFEAAAKIAGARYVVLRGAVARLHRALTQFMLDTHVREHGYVEVYVPCIVQASSLYGTGQLPKFAQDQFRIADAPESYLAPTAEVPVTNLYRESIVAADALPIRHVCHSPCFRREAGSHGQDTRGMVRQHQFEKVELVQLTRPEASWAALEELTGHAEAILRKLALPYRTVALCGGDLGFAAAKTIDLEVWLPGQQRYREISSCSNFLDFQARRMLARFRNPATRKPEFLHSINGSALAVGRTLVAVLENCQDGAGRIAVPEALRGYMDGAERLDLSAP